MINAWSLVDYLEILRWGFFSCFHTKKSKFGQKVLTFLCENRNSIKTNTRDFRTYQLQAVTNRKKILFIQMSLEIGNNEMIFNSVII